ncbi:hypothetical protein [Glaciecola sp. 1036]|uniref:hypothetical protein n=1 Tax=Alteromonadaceae TaxID=72275 RepID=UPI003D071E8B
MKKTIIAFSPHKTALTVASVLAVLSLIFLIPSFLFLASVGQGASIGAMLFLGPILYFVFGYISTALGAIIYNKVAKNTGGIQVTIKTEDDDL